MKIVHSGAYYNKDHDRFCGKAGSHIELHENIAGKELFRNEYKPLDAMGILG
jgi:hypothetical protein